MMYRTECIDRYGPNVSVYTYYERNDTTYNKG